MRRKEKQKSASIGSKGTILTIKKILEAIEKGATQRDAATLSGISEDTLSRWKGTNADFAEQIRQKEVECKMRHVHNIKIASTKNWTASAWWLERKYTDEFGKNNHVSLSLQPELQKALKKIEAFLP